MGFCAVTRKFRSFDVLTKAQYIIIYSSALPHS